MTTTRHSQDAARPLQRLHDAGVSIWLDTLSRELLETGEFARLIRDVRRAADLLRPAHASSAGTDGFVSFECTPDLADDTEATIAQALELWRRLDRDNVMIKVPATAAGVPAIEELAARGLNVNVTLLFSLEPPLEGALAVGTLLLARERRHALLLTGASSSAGRFTEEMTRSAAYTPAALEFSRAPDELARRDSEELLERMRRRRSVREFSADPVPPELIENALRTAGTAPSGANQQPWSFVVISDQAVKERIRDAAEHEEQLLYSQRASQEYLRTIEPIGTDAVKPHITDAPYLIVVFEQMWGLDADGHKHKHYYVRESVGIAVGLLITALHTAGLATLTHAPSPMGFLKEILGRPENERPFLLLPVGYPAEGASVPALDKKPLETIATFV